MPGGILDANTVDWQGDELGALAAHAMSKVGGMTYAGILLMFWRGAGLSSALDLQRKGMDLVG